MTLPLTLRLSLMLFKVVVSMWPVIHFWETTASRSVMVLWSVPAKALSMFSQG